MTEEIIEHLKLLKNCRPDVGESCIRHHPMPERNARLMVDVIIPCYQVEAFLDACVCSALKQKTKYTSRVILVDDGSTDNTPQIADSYSKNPNVLVIHQKNGGLSSARNTGLLHSTANYILFLDSDDCLPSHALEKMVSAAEKEKTGIVAGSYCNFRGFRWLGRNYAQKAGILANELELKGHAWGKLYRRELFERVQFPEKYWFEDSVTHQVLFPMSESWFGIADKVYERRVNQGSITHASAVNPKRLDSLWVTLRLMNDREKLGLAVSQSYYEYILDQVRLTHTRIGGLGREIQKAAFLVLAEEINSRFSSFSSHREDVKEMEAAVRNGVFAQFEASF